MREIPTENAPQTALQTEKSPQTKVPTAQGPFASSPMNPGFFTQFLIDNLANRAYDSATVKGP
jgi:hypothetical protein